MSKIFCNLIWWNWWNVWYIPLGQMCIYVHSIYHGPYLGAWCILLLRLKDGGIIISFESFVGISFGSGEHMIDIKFMQRVLWSLDLHILWLKLHWTSELMSQLGFCSRCPKKNAHKYCGIIAWRGRCKCEHLGSC